MPIPRLRTDGFRFRNGYDLIDYVISQQIGNATFYLVNTRGFLLLTGR